MVVHDALKLTETFTINHRRKRLYVVCEVCLCGVCYLDF